MYTPDDFNLQFHNSLTGLLPSLPGMISVIGSGGKTSLLRVLADELPGRIILSTTTKILPFQGLPLYTAEELCSLTDSGRTVFDGCRIITAAEPDPASGKLFPPALSAGALQDLADHVILEADGSRGLPLKSHAEHEPAVPDGTDCLFIVFGMSAFGCRIRNAVHRPERFCALTGTSPEDIVDAALAARHFSLELDNSPRMRQAVHKAQAVYLLLNQADTAGSPEAALRESERFRAALTPDADAAVNAVLTGSLRGRYFALVP